MGSVFWLGGLVALGENGPRGARSTGRAAPKAIVAETERVLGDLVQRDYVLRLPDSAFPGEVEFVFKHNLERERIAQLVSPGASRRQHQTIADWLAQKDNVRSQEEYSAMLARHLELAGSLTRAAFTYIDSGALARAQYAAKRAHDHYVKGLQLLGEDDARRRLDALHDHGDVLVVLGRTDEALAAFREMLRLSLPARPEGQGRRRAQPHRPAVSRHGLARHGAPGTSTAASSCSSPSAIARGVAASHDDIGKLLWVRGEYEAALEAMRTALDMRKELGDGRSIALSLNNIGKVWRDHGQEAQAREALEASLKIRREINDPLGIVESLNDLGELALDQGDAEKALGLFREAHDLAREVGEQNHIASVLTNMGEALLRLGRLEESVKTLRDAESLCDETGDKLNLAQAKRGLAKAYLEQKDLKRSRDAIKRAVDLLGQVRSKPHLAVALANARRGDGRRRLGRRARGEGGRLLHALHRDLQGNRQRARGREELPGLFELRVFVAALPAQHRHPARGEEAPVDGGRHLQAAPHRVATGMSSASDSRPDERDRGAVRLRVTHVGSVRVPLPEYQTRGAAGMDLRAALAEPGHDSLPANGASSRPASRSRSPTATRARCGRAPVSRSATASAS